MTIQKASFVNDELTKLSKDPRYNARPNAESVWKTFMALSWYFKVLIVTSIICFFAFLYVLYKMMSLLDSQHQERVVALFGLLVIVFAAQVVLHYKGFL